MNDDAAFTALTDRLAEVRESMSGVRMTRPASEIFARAKKRGSRRISSSQARLAAVPPIASAGRPVP